MTFAVRIPVNKDNNIRTEGLDISAAVRIVAVIDPGALRGIIGNPVRVGDGPAAVTLASFPSGARKGELFRPYPCHCSEPGTGRPPEGEGSQKTCLGPWGCASADRR